MEEIKVIKEMGEMEEIKKKLFCTRAKCVSGNHEGQNKPRCRIFGGGKVGVYVEFQTFSGVDKKGLLIIADGSTE